MESVYLETTFISYLVARPSRDLLVAAHQQVTQFWWENRRQDFECYVSQVVIDEASAGNAQEIEKRAAIIAGLKELDLSDEVGALTQQIMSIGILPPQAMRDAAHIAVATVYGMDYLLSWNCRHLANAKISRRIALECQLLGFRTPTICTPEELLEG